MGRRRCIGVGIGKRRRRMLPRRTWCRRDSTGQGRLNSVACGVTVGKSGSRAIARRAWRRHDSLKVRCRYDSHNRMDKIPHT